MFLFVSVFCIIYTVLLWDSSLHHSGNMCIYTYFIRMILIIYNIIHLKPRLTYKSPKVLYWSVLIGLIDIHFLYFILCSSYLKFELFSHYANQSLLSTCGCHTWGDGKNMFHIRRHRGYIISMPFLWLRLCSILNMGRIQRSSHGDVDGFSQFLNSDLL